MTKTYIGKYCHSAEVASLGESDFEKVRVIKVISVMQEVKGGKTNL